MHLHYKDYIYAHIYIYMITFPFANHSTEVSQQLLIHFAMNYYFKYTPIKH